MALFALLVIILGFIFVGQGYVTGGAEPVAEHLSFIYTWAPGGWWPRHPTATLRLGWATTAVGMALLLVAVYRQLSA
ncbi:hypothetical protein GCM10027290_66400 [Micromonospora sonneratiae]